MLAKRWLLTFGLTILGAMLLVGCAALRGPEPPGPTFVAPPGPIVSGGAVRTVPPSRPQFSPYAPVPSLAPSQPSLPAYGPSPPPGDQQLDAPPAIQSPPSLAGESRSAIVPEAPGRSSAVGPDPAAPGISREGTAPAPLPQVTLQITGPTRGTAGAPVSYRFDVANGSAAAAREVTVVCQMPEGWAFVSSTVAGAATGRQVQWRLGDLPAYRRLSIDAILRPETAGMAQLCADLSVAGAAPRRTCVTVDVGASPAPGKGRTDPLVPAAPARPQLEVVIRGPDRAVTGEEVTYDVTVTNRGAARATKLLVTDEFSSGLAHDVAQSPIEKDLEDLAPGESTTFKVTFKVTRPGRHCHNVEVTGADGVRGSAEACVTAAGSPKLSIHQVATPTSTQLGGKVRFAIDIKNEGDIDLTGVVVSSNFDRPLKPIQATEVRGRQALANLKNDRYELTPWRFERLEPGRAIQLDVECLTEQAAASACGRVTVTSQEGVREEAVTCLRIDGSTDGAAKKPLGP